MYPDTGALAAPFTPARSGFEARIDLANDEGGVLGRTIDVVWEDDAGVPSQNGLVAQGLVEREGVFAVAELTTAASGSAQYLADAGIPVVGLAADATWNDYDNMFVAGYLYSNGESVTTFGDFVAAQGGTKVAVVEDPLSDSAQSFSDQLLDSMAHHGIQAVARLPY
nr:ABC transporter substrate-binding protein [Micromonospora sp. DSM 115978]